MESSVLCLDGFGSLQSFKTAAFAETVSSVLLSHCKFPRSAKLHFLHLILKYSWDSAHMPWCSLSIWSLWRKLEEITFSLHSDRYSNSFWRGYALLVLLFRPCEFYRNKLKIFLEKPVQQGVTNSHLGSSQLCQFVTNVWFRVAQKIIIKGISKRGFNINL